MKKFGKILLIVYVTAVTICCGVFAYLYFSQVNKTNDLSTHEAKILVNKIYDDILSSTNTNDTSSTALNYEDFNEEKLNLRKHVKFDQSEIFISIFGTKFVMDNTSTPKTYYKSTDNDSTFELYYEISGQSIYTYMYSKSSYTTLNIITKMTKTEDGWSIQSLDLSENESENYYLYVKYTADKNGIYEASIINTSTKTEEKLNSKINSEQNINECIVGDYNTKTKKQINRVTLTESKEIIEQTNKIVEVKRDLSPISFENTNPKQSNFLAESLRAIRATGDNN